MPVDTTEKLYDLLVLLMMISIPFLLAGVWVLYRLVRGHRWRQREILHTNIAILQTNQAILNALMSAIPKERRPRLTPVPREATSGEKNAKGPAPKKRHPTPVPRSKAQPAGDPKKQ